MDTAAELENARALRRFGRHKAAAEICRKVLDRQPNHADALLVLGTVAADLRDSRSAVGFLTRAVDQDPKHPGAALLLAEVLSTLGIVDGAVAWYRVALEVKADAPSAAPALARLLASGGRIEEIVALARRQLDQGRPAVAVEAALIGRAAAPNDAEAALVAGEAMIAAGDGAGAAGSLRAAAATRARDARLLAMLSRSLGGEPAWLRRALSIAESGEVRAELGAALSGRGDQAGAQRCFEIALAADRDDRMALNGLARLRLLQGEPDGAIGLARRRLASDPEDAEAAWILGAALARRELAGSAMTFAQSAAKAGRLPVMRAVAAGVISVDPERMDAWRMLGSPRAFRVILGREPADAGAMVGIAAEGADDNALAWLERAIRLDTSAATVLPLARVLVRSRGTEPARALLRQLLTTLDPRRGPVPPDLPALLTEIGETEPAIRLLDVMTSADPENPDLADSQIRALSRHGDAASLVRLSRSHGEKRRTPFAAAALGAARKLKPDSAELALLHGHALAENGERAAAVDAYADAADMIGDANLDLLTQAGQALVGLQATSLGLRYLRLAVEKDFANPGRHTYSFFFSFLNQCDWPARKDYVERLTALAEAKIAADDPDFRINPSLWVFLAAERDLLYRSADHFARHTFSTAPPPAVPATGADPERRIRLGYISAYLYSHNIGYSLAGILQAHDRAQVEVYLYGYTRDDPIQATLKREAHLFRPIDGKDPAAIARLIAADGIDVLVDLDGYVNSASGLMTMEVASRRPAPVQMLYHTYVGPTGTGFVDYVIADRELLDAYDDAGYRERLIRLPPCYYPAAPLPKAKIPTDRQSWGLPATGTVFCNFGHFYKVEPTVFDVWMRILRRVPGSVLWMNHWDNPEAMGNLRREAEARGIDPARLVFAAVATKAMHLNRIALADLFLDTLVYASGVTSLDVLWGGVPVLTVRGSTFARRVGASLNAGLGMQDMTCPDAATYEELAVALGTDRPRLASIRARLAANLQTHPLFDQARLARNLERAYRAAFRRYVAGKPPESFELSP